ncbi:MAG: adenylate/guanylate cyclase domain-containing protein, partial [Candidatus Cloacimonetes bacterium]|nr:adenylate/guanylate cyclase domain-containing protein [Candidatus Cloacimonadota bacterium]
MNNDDILFGTDFFDLELDNKTQKEKLMLREGELREVTILFADIKGFTDLSTHYDPEIIHLKMDEIMKIFSKCITFYGGFVDKYMGDGIMALFGAKKATEQDPQRAILAALKMQQQLRLYNSLLNEQESFREVTLGLRIGINSGLVSVGKVGESREGDFTVYGPEVNLASRMESNAPVNRIMLPDHTKKIIEHIFEFEHRGEIQVKGIEEAINCWTVIGLKTEKAPRWQSSSHKFIGREIELKTLFDAYTQIQSAAAISTEIAVQIIGIQGEPGLGKTRLIYEFEKQIQTINPKPKILHAACNGICPTPLNLFANLFEAVFGLRISEALDTKKQKLTQGFKALETDNTKQQEALNDALNMIAFLLEIRGNDPRLKQSGKDLLQHL